MNCLYHLDKTSYEYYSRKLANDIRAYDCACNHCVYYRKRIEAKELVPKSVYDSPTFQQSLRMVNGLDYEDFVLTRSQLDTFISDLLGLR